MIEWLPAVALAGFTVWFSLKAAAERLEEVLAEQQHEQFWGDGKTSDGTWADELHGAGVVETGDPQATVADLRQISPDPEEAVRPTYGRHRDPAKTRGRGPVRAGERLTLRAHRFTPRRPGTTRDGAAGPGLDAN